MSAKSCECMLLHWALCAPVQGRKVSTGFFFFSFLSFYIFLLPFTLLTFHLFNLPQKSEIEVALNDRFLPYSNIAFVDFCSGSFNKKANMKISHWKTLLWVYIWSSVQVLCFVIPQTASSFPTYWQIVQQEQLRDEVKTRVETDYTGKEETLTESKCKVYTGSYYSKH